MDINSRKLQIPLTVLLAISSLEAMAETADLVAGPLKEVVRSSANTGGASVMGLQMTGVDPTQDIHALLPIDWGGQTFCVRTTSSDGLYSSENTYVAPATTETTIEIPHVALSRHQGRLSRFANQNFGIRIAFGDCGTQEDSMPAAIALWQSDTPAETLDIYVNGFGAQRLVSIPVVDGERHSSVECQLIEAEVRVAFDRLCQIPVGNGAKAASITLVPFKGGVRGRSETLEVLMR